MEAKVGAPMRVRPLVLLLSLTVIAAGCVKGGTDGPGGDDGDTGSTAPAAGLFTVYTLPAVFGDPATDADGASIGLYEPTIDVGPEGNIYVSAHSTRVGRYPAPAYYSVDDGVTWLSMALAADQQMSPEQQGSAPLFSDEVFIIAGDEGTAWGADCCNERNEFPVAGWCADGAEVCYYNQNARDPTRQVLDPVMTSGACVPLPTTDRPWLAYANGKLLMVNNPGGALISANGQIPIQLAAMDVPPATPVAYTGLAWGIEWNLCGSTGGFIPGIPDMREDHFFAIPQWVDFATEGCGAESHYDVVTGNADDVYTLTQTTVFANSHVAPAESDSSASNVGQYGQAVFDASGALYIGAMNNTAVEGGDDECTAGVGGIHLAWSGDEAKTFVETTLRFARPVSSFYMDGNRHGEGFLLSWGEIDGANTDWFAAHVFPNADSTLRLENVMLAVDDGPEASRHVQGAALGPDGRAYLALSLNSQNPGGAHAEPGDTPLRVAVQQDGPTMPVS